MTQIKRRMSKIDKDKWISRIRASHKVIRSAQKPWDLAVALIRELGNVAEPDVREASAFFDLIMAEDVFKLFSRIWSWAAEALHAISEASGDVARPAQPDAWVRDISRVVCLALTHTVAIFTSFKSPTMQLIGSSQPGRVKLRSFMLHFQSSGFLKELLTLSAQLPTMAKLAPKTSDSDLSLPVLVRDYVWEMWKFNIISRVTARALMSCLLPKHRLGRLS